MDELTERGLRDLRGKSDGSRPRGAAKAVVEERHATTRRRTLKLDMEKIEIQAMVTKLKKI